MARMIDIMQQNGRLYSLPNPDFQHPFKNVRNCGNKRGQIENHLWKNERLYNENDFEPFDQHLENANWKMPGNG